MNRCLFALMFLISSCLPSSKSSQLQFFEGPAPSLVTIQANTSVHYDNLKQHVLNRHCISCHNSERSEGEIDLSSYEAITTPLEIPLYKPGLPKRSRLWRSVAKKTMPPGRRPKLSDLEIAFIGKWIEQCAPEKQNNYIDCQMTKFQLEE